MGLVIFGLVCFWSGVAGLIAHLCGLWEVPAVLTIGVLAALILSLAGCLCQAAGTSSQAEVERPISLQAYFGGTFKTRSSRDGVRLRH